VPFSYEFMQARCAQTFRFVDITEDDMRLVIKNLKDNCATGFDDVSSAVIKQCGDVLLQPLLKLANSMLRDGNFPSLLKTARVVVVYKGGSKNDFGNYRPISVLSVFSKIFESLLYKPLYDFIETNGILTDSQYGFRKGRSTEMALIKIKENILRSFAEGNYVTGLFFDIRKAFDSLDHELLLVKLEHYGIRNGALKLIGNYLSHRKQYVVVNNFASAMTQIKQGVPQGSNLGPLLFLLFINDFVNIYSGAQYLMFADDSNVFIKGSLLSDLEMHCNEVCRMALLWSKLNKLSLNETKTKLMVFRPKNKPMCPLEISLGAHKATIVDQIKFLGVIFDTQLRWDVHITEMCSQLRKVCGIIGTTRSLLPTRIKRQLYYALFYPRLYYNLLIYGTACSTHLQQIHLLQNRTIRHIDNASLDSHHTDLYKKYNILSIHALYAYKLLRLTHHSNETKNFYIVTANLMEHVPHRYDSRYTDKYIVPFCRTNYEQQALRYTLPKHQNAHHMLTSHTDNKKLVRDKLFTYFIESVCCNS